MVYGLPTTGEADWGTKVNDSIAAVKTTADAALPAAQKGAASGVAPLDAAQKLPETNVPERLTEAGLSASTAAEALLLADRPQHAPAFGWYFPEAEGAVADGTTDDTLAIQAAINAAALDPDTPGIVLLSAGRRYLASQLRMKTGVTLQGGGWYTRIFQVSPFTGDLIVLDTADTTDVTIRDLTLNGVKGTQTAANRGIYFDHTGSDPAILPRHRIFNVAVRSTKGDGIHLGFRTRITHVDNVSIYGADGHGFVLAGADSQINNVDVASSGLNGFEITGGAYVITSTKAWTSGRIDGIGSGYRIAGPTISLVGAHAQENMGRGFYFFRSGVTITGFVGSGLIADSDNASDVGYVEFDLQNVDGAIIQGQVVKAAGIGGTAPSGLQIGSGAGNDITLGISGVSSWLVTTGSVLAGNTVRINGREERVFALTAAATLNPNPWAARTFTCTLDQATTINNPTPKPAGTMMRFVLTQDATGGRTVTFGTDYKVGWTPDTTAGKKNVIDFVCDGTNWVQVAAATGL